VGEGGVAGGRGRLDRSDPAGFGAKVDGYKAGRCRLKPVVPGLTALGFTRS